MDNYAIARDRAQDFFLKYDQDAILRSWDLEADENFLYADFFGRPYSICRKTGQILRRADGTQAGFSEVLSIFDFLCHEGERKQLTGSFAPVNSLRGGPRAVGVGTDFHSKTAALFDRDPEGFRSACLSLGGRAVAMGDMGFRFPLFGKMDVILKFYRSDEEFPASITLLWEENTLQFLYYETVHYIAGFILQTIADAMRDQA